MSRTIRVGALAMAIIACGGVASVGAQCTGDCNGDHAVVVSELVRAVAITLDMQPLSACSAADANHDDSVTINELILGVNAALNGCPATPTSTIALRTATATSTATNTRSLPSSTSTSAPPRTATATSTATMVPTTAPSTATMTRAASGTATAVSTQTATGVPTGTASATATTGSTRTATHTATSTASAVRTPTATTTAMSAEVCPAAPRANCKQPLAAGSSSLLLKSKGGVRDHLVWKWTNGPATPASEFGSPRTVTAYALCLYDEAGGVAINVLAARIPPGSKWALTKTGYHYGDRAASAAGVTNVLLQAGSDGHAALIVKGKGLGLGLPRLPLRQDRHVIVQLLNTSTGGSCWEARYTRPAKTNDQQKFEDASDGPFPTPSGSPTAAITATATRTRTASATATLAAATPTGSVAGTATATIPAMISATATVSISPTATVTSPLATATRTAVATATPTTSAVHTATATSAVVATPTASASRTATATAAPATPTGTPVATPTRTSGPAASTPTATPTVTFTPTTVPTGGAMCGNGFLEAGETCTSCAADCTVQACTATTPMQTVRVDFTAPLGTSPSVAGVLVGYKSNRVSLPNTGTGARVKLRPAGTSQLVKDLDYAVRVVLNASAGSSIATGRIFTVDFDSCQGQAAVTPADFGCQIESCGSSTGPIDGCACSVVLP